MCFNYYAVDPKNIGFQCETLWNSQEYFFSFNLTWTLPEFLNDNITNGFSISYGIVREESGLRTMADERTIIQLPKVS